MPDSERSSVNWRRIEAGTYESPDGRWRVINPWRLDTGLRRRWIVHERDGNEWFAHDVDYATRREAIGYTVAEWHPDNAHNGPSE